MNSRVHSAVSIAVLAAIGTSLAAPAHAQAPAAAANANTSGTLEEVVVTARKREESARDVPITESVFTEQTIKSAGIESPRDYIAMVPNMTLVETQNVGNSFVTIRGISQARNSEPSVAVLVDGVLETNPYQFTQELYDIKQIEVLKGPQGALYGRDAIGGAIIINTADLSDQFEGNARVGVGNGTSERAQLAVSGPLDSSGSLKYRASVNFYNTDGYLHNAYLDRKADPNRDYSARLRLLWKSSDALSADLRFFYDRVETTAYYFVIPRANEQNPFSDVGIPPVNFPPDANDVTSPIQNNNLGSDNRDVLDVALKLDFNPGYGTITSVSNYDQTKEIDTGDAYDFRPVATSLVYSATGGTFGGPVDPNAFPFDESQAQFIRVRAWSQELRFTSPKAGNLSWIAGAYYIHTERFISTGNIIDRGVGTVPPVYETPIVDPANPFATNTNATFLADSQNNNAWALFADATYDFTPKWELDTAIRYDEDTRANTTDTPPAFLAMVGDPNAFTGQVRKQTWDEVQPKATLRFKPSDESTFYGGWSRGFRSGGFNQTGVGTVAVANGIAGVGDLFNAEVADTWEVGWKQEFLERRLNVGLSAFRTDSRNSYFFVFLAANSTQNLGNIPEVIYKGLEGELTARVTDNLTLYLNAGYTDSDITKAPDPSQTHNEAPLVSRDTIAAGVQYRQPFGGEMAGVLRLDFNSIGRTWWDPQNSTSRDPVNLLDLRLGLEADKWSLTAWSKNLTDKKYNAEFSPGGFLWRALPRRYGIDFNYKF
ncbi:MAG TPA: TonB-dependent receptor [Steroidobacteraceae bacterium]|nr:TonB-dependent receptor [Steroidobacteraceae bacterium]